MTSGVMFCCCLMTLLSEAAIFYPPFPSPGQYHEPPPTAHPSHIGLLQPNPYMRSHNPHSTLLTLIHLYLNQLQRPQYHPPPAQMFLPHPQPTTTPGEVEGGPTEAPGFPIGGAVVDGSLGQGPAAEAEGTVTTTPTGGAMMGPLGGLIVNGGPPGLHGGSMGMNGGSIGMNGGSIGMNGGSIGLHGGSIGLNRGSLGLHGVSLGLPPPNQGPAPPVPTPRIYNMRNNAPNNPLPIAQIRNTFYERLCFQTQPTVMPIIQAFIPSIRYPIIPADAADPPACSCIPFNNCESAAHRVINQKTKDECGSTLTGFACCCEEPPHFGK